MRKICLLLDPNKKEISNVFKACCLLKKSFNKDFLKKKVEFWVGCTSASGLQVRKWVQELEKEDIEPRVIFPGKVSQAIYAYPYANYLMAPHLLNWSKRSIFIKNIFGLILTKFFGKRVDFGYLVVSNYSSVGRRIGAKYIDDNEAFELLKNYVSNNSDNPYVYIEAGSDAKRPVNGSLIKRVHSFLTSRYKQSCLMVGGGIKNKETAKRFFSEGADKVILGTVLEQKTVEKSLNIMSDFLSLLK